MKLVTFADTQGRQLVGAVVGTASAERVLDLAAAARRSGEPDQAFGSMLALIDAGSAGLDLARRLVEARSGDEDLSQPLAATRLLAPIPVPPQMRDFSVFPGHIIQAPVGMRRIVARMQGDEAAAAAVKPDADVPQVYRDRPIYYITNRFSVVGTGTEVVWPSYSKLMDFELEFGIVLGRGGTDIARDKAKDHIFGYTIFNDFSARDAQLAEMQGMLGPTKGKSFDAGNAMGPYLVTADAVKDPYALKAVARINGETWTDTTTAGMLHSFEDMIAYVSRSETLHAGEFFGSGTVGGGCGLELDRFLKAGDVVELTVEGLGTLTNRVVRKDA
ncbi:fumarylacetoacetate hydrolase family protein [Phreatobacter stygius]|uniref:Fumarylacetoacetate hydrolase family protein n=1 Tax=Phreatobacter stygius TaxID=1940610 RepID=A0A4D7B253_9HYPH|nr:fumarylacetoacetate hydrolase family protein [Phreatobacter stygius]QCI65405.1 fumarylacetoacetate hydrolase family protein [Phreatobacter stygius]